MAKKSETKENINRVSKFIDNVAKEFSDNGNLAVMAYSGGFFKTSREAARKAVIAGIDLCEYYDHRESRPETIDALARILVNVLAYAEDKKEGLALCQKIYDEGKIFEEHRAEFVISMAMAADPVHLTSLRDVR